MVSILRAASCSTILVCSVLVAQGQVRLPPGGGAPPAPAPDPVVGTGILAGRIVDPSGAAVPHATVALSGNPAAALLQRARGTDRVVADAQGRFAFVALPPGAYSVNVSKPGWLPGAYGRKHPRGGSARVQLTDGERKADLTITMWRTAVIGGRVVADNGEPLIGAEVRAIRQTYMGGRRVPLTPLREKTDDRGVFRFSNLQPGDYLVAVINTVLSEPATFSGAIRSGGETPRAYLQTQAGVATGSIVMDRATGLAGKDQPLFRTLGPHLGGQPIDGKPWLIYPTAWHPAAPQRSDADVVTVRAGEVRDDVNISVALTSAWQVSGVVRDAGGPAAWHAVHLVPADTAEDPLFDVAIAVTDATGAFTFYGVPRGAYVARVVRVPAPSDSALRLGLIGGTGQLLQLGMIGRAASGGPPQPAEPLFHASAPLTVGGQDMKGLVLTLQRAPRISGVAQFAGDPPRNPVKEEVRIVFEPATGAEDRYWYPVLVGPDGRFSGESLLPGRYFLRVQSASWQLDGASHQGRELFDRSIDLTGDIDGIALRLVRARGVVRGTVRAGTSDDLRDAVVVWFPIDSTTWSELGRGSVRMSSTPVREDGSFELPMPPAGSYFIAAIPGEDADGWQNPSTMKRIAAIAERVNVGGAAVDGLVLILRPLK